MPETATLDELTITPVRVPDRADQVNDDTFADFRAAIDVRNRVGEAVRFADSVHVTPAQSLPHWHDDQEEVHAWLLRSRGDVVGRAMLYLPLEEGSRRAQLRAEVLPEPEFPYWLVTQETLPDAEGLFPVVEGVEDQFAELWGKG
jgi:hypothetical protein